MYCFLFTDVPPHKKRKNKKNTNTTKKRKKPDTSSPKQGPSKKRAKKNKCKHKGKWAMSQVCLKNSTMHIMCDRKTRLKCYSCGKDLQWNVLFAFCMECNDPSIVVHKKNECISGLNIVNGPKKGRKGKSK